MLIKIVTKYFSKRCFASSSFTNHNGIH
jgi:hypothetical protein